MRLLLFACILLCATQANRLYGYYWTQLNGEVTWAVFVSKVGSTVTVQSRAKGTRPVQIEYDQLTTDDQAHISVILENEERLESLYDTCWAGRWNDGTPVYFSITRSISHRGYFSYSEKSLCENGRFTSGSAVGAIEGEHYRTKCRYLKIQDGVAYLVGSCNDKAAQLVQIPELPDDLKAFDPSRSGWEHSELSQQDFAAKHFGDSDIFFNCKPSRDFDRAVGFLRNGQPAEALKPTEHYLLKVSPSDFYNTAIYAHSVAARANLRLGNHESARSLVRESLRRLKQAANDGDFLNNYCLVKGILFASYWGTGEITQAKLIQDELTMLAQAYDDLPRHEPKAYQRWITYGEYYPWVSRQMDIDYLLGMRGKALGDLTDQIDEIRQASLRGDLDERNRAALLRLSMGLVLSLEGIGDYEGALREIAAVNEVEFTKFKRYQLYGWVRDATELQLQFLLGEVSIEVFESTTDGLSRQIYAYHDYAWQLVYERLLARTYLSAGKLEQALEHINQAYGLIEENELVQYYAKTLRVRAGIYNEMGRPEDCIRDVTFAIEILREKGTKYEEPYLYYEYARALLMLGRGPEAVRFLNVAVDLAEKFGQPHIALNALKVLLGYYIDEQQFNAADEVRARVDELLAECSEIMPIWRVGLPDLYAQVDVGRRSKLIDAAPIVGRLPADSKSPESIVIVDRAASSVTLQPVKLDTQVLSGEIGYGLFTLVNYGDKLVTGELSVSSTVGVSTLSWLDGESVELEVLEGSVGWERSSLSLSLEPGVPLLVSGAYSLVEVGDLKLVWVAGGVEETAIWSIRHDPEFQSVSLVDAGEVQDDPFSYIPFYNRVYLREGGASVLDLTVKASVLSRVEIYNLNTAELLAVDVNGDGDYLDRGDYIAYDLNRNSLPDLNQEEGVEVQGVEVWVFPDYEEIESVTDRIKYELRILGDGVDSSMLNILRIQ